MLNLLPWHHKLNVSKGKPSIDWSSLFMSRYFLEKYIYNDFKILHNVLQWKVFFFAGHHVGAHQLTTDWIELHSRELQ